MKAPLVKHYLSDHQMFNFLTESQLNDLINNFQIKHFKRGDHVAYRDEKIYLNLSGKLKVCEMDDDGNEMVKEIIKEGDFLGDMSFYGKSLQYIEYAEAISGKVVIGVVPLAIFEEIMKTNSLFSVSFSKAIWSRYKNFERRYRNLAFMKCTRTRLINFFKDLAINEGERMGNKIVVKNYLTHKEIASLICSTRVTVTAILNDLRETGNFNYSKEVIEITDINRL